MLLGSGFVGAKGVGIQLDHTRSGVGLVTPGGASAIVPMLMNPPSASSAEILSAVLRTSSWHRSPLKMMAPNPMRCAAERMLPRAAPALSDCSSTGTRGCRCVLTTKARTTGAWVACSRARWTSSGQATGSRRSFSAANKAAKSLRVSGGNSITRQGRSPP